MNKRAPVSPDAAAQWLARRDRGLSAEEQIAFDRWRRDSANAREFAELEGPFAALDRAAQLQPAEGAWIDKDLLARGRRRTSRRAVWLASALGAAAAIAFAVFSLDDWPRHAPASATPRGVVVRHAPVRLALPDGSTVEFKPGTRVETDFTPQERRLRLSAGDAHFTVAKDATRPFIVAVGPVAVRAVGTAFTISASAATVEVLVTEGRVCVDDGEGRSLIAHEAAAVELVPGLDAGQRVVIPVKVGQPVSTAVMAATAETLERAAAWRSVWLEFSDMPLAAVAREFNRQAGEYRQPQLRAIDELTGRVLVSGTFRADGVEAFVRLLHSSFGIHATREADGALTLRQTK